MKVGAVADSEAEMEAATGATVVAEAEVAAIEISIAMKVSAAVGLKEALMQSKALVVERTTLVAEMVAAGACVER